MKDPEQTGTFVGLTANGVPADRAKRKIVDTRRGWMFVGLGLFFIAGAFGFIIWTMVVTKGTPSIALLVFAALPGLPGAYFLLAGGHLISGDAMLAAEGSGDVLARTAAKLLRVARPKGGP